jgi:SNF2 family DNA or RNA helicase
MGLGKTVQLIALAIYGVKRADRNNSNILIVVPSSLKGNWREEFVKFSPNYQPYFHTGPDRKFLARDLVQNRIILTTYGILISDIDLLKAIPWEIIICDEAHSLKNPDARRREALSLLKCKSKFLATGTPIENELMDLWSLMDLIRPGIMGERNEFRSQCEVDSSFGEEIGSSIKPLILRRLVADVLKSLPPFIEIDEVLECEAEFAKAYEDLRLGLVSMTKSMPTIAIIQKLRMFCCYPVLISPELAGITDVKIDRLLEILDEIMIRENDKVLVFTSFHDSADYLLQMLSREYDGRFIRVIDGRDNQETRDAIIKEFSQTPGFSILIANPRAAGEGLNIVAANHVIHFNREWNPQKENQANARARRPGQTKTVFVHRMFYKDTIEEVMSERLLQKIELADGTLLETELEGDNKSIDRALTISPIMNYANY